MCSSMGKNSINLEELFSSNHSLWHSEHMVHNAYTFLRL